MKMRTYKVLIILSLLPFLTHCASQSEVDKLKYQLRIVNKKVDDMKQETVDKMQQRQASSLNQIERLKKETMLLRGQLEEMAHFNRQLTQQNKELEASFNKYSDKMIAEIEKERKTFSSKDKEKDQKIGELEKRLTLQQSAVKKIQEARILEKQRKAEEAAKAAEAARAKALASQKALQSNNSGILQIRADKKKIYSVSGTSSTVPAQNTTTPPAQPKTEKPSQQPATDLFSQADKAFANGNFKNAYSLYSEFANANKNSDKAITARFMMGESRFHQKEYNQAILEYQKIISNYPGHPRAASSFLKQGMAFEKLSEFDTAKVIYKKIMSSYSKSPEAITAKERSEKLAQQ